MAAIYLNRFAQRLNVKVTLVESPTLGTIGVGEATIPSLVEFVRTLNLDEKEFMRRCSASFKLAIKFDGWMGDGSAYWHSFGLCGGQVNGLDLFHYWLKRRYETASRLGYSDYSLQTRLCEQSKAPWPFAGASAISQLGAYAYHLDAAALAEYLRELATAEGVQHLFGHVQSVALDDRGHIASLGIGGDRSLEGDLFLDATGFSGRLIEKELGDPWIDWGRYMLCDSAVAMPLPRSDEFPPYTLSKAMPSGWMWKIPLNNRVGNGYVFSSAHISADEATAALIAQSGFRKERSADPRTLKIRVGRRTRFWVRNCVAVGLASGFVEPLESTGIHIIHKAVKLLVKYLPDRDFNDALRDAYNREMDELYDEVRDFIVLHYWLAKREEPFWRDSRNVPLPESLRARIALYDETGRIESNKRELFVETSYFFIFTGAGRLPRRMIAEAESAGRGDVWRILDGIRADNCDFAERMPPHGAYLEQLHRRAV
jgi:tryptophan halogenase